MPKNARSSGAAAAAEKVAGNTHMLWEILIRMPLKPLIRLKCVSKQWRTLISDEQFLDSHSLHHHQHHCCPNSLILSNDLNDGPSHILSFTTTTPTPRALNFDFLNQPEATVICSCNGLLLCRGYDSTTHFVCNPITQDFTTLNLRRHPLWAKDKSIHLYLAFDPSISPHRYKVVSLVVGSSPLDWVFHVYTFKTRSRISHGVSISTPFELDPANGVYCNGAIHWYNNGGFSVYFDVDTQSLKNYPMPLSDSEWLEQDMWIIYFGESGGRLHMMLSVSWQNYNNNDCFVHDLFELKQDYSGWSLRHRVDLNPLRVEFPRRAWRWHDLNFHIVCTTKVKNKKSSMLVLIVGKEGAIFYDPVDKTSRKLYDFDKSTTPIQMRYSLAFGLELLYCDNLVQPKDANCLN